MESAQNLINEIGSEIKAKHEVSIDELIIEGNIATFQAGENRNQFIMKFNQCDTDDENGQVSIEVDVLELTLLVDFGSEKYVPIDVSLEEKHLFVCTAIEELIAAEIYRIRKEQAEKDHWENLIDHYQSKKYLRFKADETIGHQSL